MKLLQSFKRLALLGAVITIGLSCGDDDPSPGGSDPFAITINGGHSLKVGESLTLDASSSSDADSAFSWESSNPDVAEVDAAGMVTGVAEGEATISATASESGATGDHVIVVGEDVEPFVGVSVTGTPFVEVGSVVMLSAATTGAEDSDYLWETSDEGVATVDGSGSVTGVAAGEVEITATGNDSGMSGSLTVVVAYELPQYTAWLGSAHADTGAEAFTHWNEDDPPVVPEACGKCHATPGYMDFLGADGSTPNVVDAAHPVGSVIECQACHNDAANELTEVEFPSGEVVDMLGDEARCMVCHQGRSSGDDVNEAIEMAAVVSDDQVSEDLGFLNIHYYAAAATINAGRVRGGYQYEDQVYDWRFRHVPGYDTCTGCHDPHTLEVKVDACTSCHADVTNLDSLKDIRMIASLGQDYDGDGNQTEGIYYEMTGLGDLLYAAIQAYTIEQGLGGICYANAYPYWFQDTNQDGACDEDEASFGNAFDAWTARLLKATYNYQVGNKDPGAFAHNAKYIIQLLYDATADLNAALTTPVDLTNAVRNDFGHFNGASEAARHWDEDEAVSPSCSKCHGGSEGFRFFLKHGVGIDVVEPDNGLDCATCHDDYAPTWSVVAVDDVTFPGDLTISDPGQTSNVCYVCHSGRESKATIDDAIAAGNLSFRNVHYLPAGGTKKGTEAQVGYEYPNKTYAGEWTTHGRCINCHEPVVTNHTFSPYDNPACTDGCHSPTLIENIRTNHVLDYDGDNDDTEPLRDEIQGLATALIAQMGQVSGSPALCYDTNAYPYFFYDTNGNGSCDPNEAIFPNRFQDWTPALMKAAHNFQISQKEPGAWAHNFDYMAQLLIDSIEDLGGNVSGYVRP